MNALHTFEYTYVGIPWLSHSNWNVYIWSKWYEQSTFHLWTLYRPLHHLDASRMFTMKSDPLNKSRNATCSMNLRYALLKLYTRFIKFQWIAAAIWISTHFTVTIKLIYRWAVKATQTLISICKFKFSFRDLIVYNKNYNERSINSVIQMTNCWLSVLFFHTSNHTNDESM